MWLTHLDHSPPLKETKTGTQAEQEPETMKEPCLLTCLLSMAMTCNLMEAISQPRLPLSR